MMSLSEPTTSGRDTESASSEACPRCGFPVPEDAPGAQCPKCLLGAVAEPTGPLPDFRSGAACWPTADEVRAAFPELEVEAEIGRGGMASVFKARQPHLDRMVALKVLAPWLAAEPGFAERFAREARVLARLSHTNIVVLHDFGQSAGFYYLLMEFVDGVNLRQAMAAGRFTAAQALALVPKICDALEYAHSEGVLHRDIKPDNILLDSRGRVKIADFGIAKLSGESGKGHFLTGTGMHLGTPAYMAPEQIEKRGDVDHRADIYSLGVVFYEMLTGELPLGRFAAPSEKSVIDSRIDEIVMRTLEKERDRRFQSAEAVKTEVEGLGGRAGRRRAVPDSAGKPLHGVRFGQARLSGRASAGATCTLLSALLAVFIGHWTLLSWPGENTGPGIFMALPVCVLSGVAGAVLGFDGLRQIRKIGYLRGVRRGIFALLGWPVLLLVSAIVWKAYTRWPAFTWLVKGGQGGGWTFIGQERYLLPLMVAGGCFLIWCLASLLLWSDFCRTTRARISWIVLLFAGGGVLLWWMGNHSFSWYPYPPPLP